MYFYDVKIQTNIKQNLVEKYVEESQIFKNIFLKFVFGPGWTRPTHFGLGWTSPTQWTVETVHWRRRRRRKRGEPAVLLAVAGQRMAWTTVGLSSYFLCFFCLCSVLPLVPCFIPSPSLWSFFYFCGSNCCCSRCWWWRWWPNVATNGGSRRRLLLLSPLFLLFLCLYLFVLLLLFLTGQGLLPMTGRTVATGGGSGVALVAVANWGELMVADGFFLSVFSSPSISVLLLLSLLLLFLMVAAIVGGAMVVLFCDGSSVGGGWEERWRRWWRCNDGSSPPSSVLPFHSPFSLLFLFLLFCPSSSPLKQTLPTIFCSPLLLQNFAPPHLLVPPLVFISRGGKGHLTPAMTQGKVGDERCW